MAKVFFEFTAELARTFVAEIVRHSLGRVAVLDQLAGQAHSECLHPLLWRLLKLPEKETFQLSLRDEAFAGKVLTPIARHSRDSGPIDHVVQATPHFTNT